MRVGPEPGLVIPGRRGFNTGKGTFAGMAPEPGPGHRSACHGAKVWIPPARCTGCGHRTMLAADDPEVTWLPQTRHMPWVWWLAELPMRLLARRVLR